MPIQNASRVIPPSVGRPRGPVKVMLPVKLTEAERRRFKVACAEENMSYGELVMRLLDERDQRRERSQRRQVHPFHRPGE